MIKEEIETDKKKFADYKRVLDAINTLDYLLEKDRLSPTHPRVVNLQIELIQLIAGIPNQNHQGVNQNQESRAQSFYLAYIIQFTSLKHQIEASAVEEETKTALIAQCDRLTQKCYRNLDKQLSKEFEEEDKLFLDTQFKELKAIQGS